MNAEFPAAVSALKEVVLKRAKAKGDEWVQEALVKLHTISEKTISGILALCTAAGTGDVDAVRKILTEQNVDNQFSVNDCDYHGATAVHVASGKGFNSVVAVLINEFNADVTLVDDAGATPLQRAVRAGHLDVATTLRNAGGVLGWDEATMSGELCEAARAGKLSSFSLMLKAGADINAKDYDGRTPLHLAASVGNLKITEYILKHGGTVNAKDRWGGTPLRDAVREGYPEIANKLRQVSRELGYDDGEG